MEERPFRWRELPPVVVAIIVCQAVLYGPSLAGWRILAPTDLLLVGGPLGPQAIDATTAPTNYLLQDPILVFLPWLEFAAREVRAGRLPLWNPYAYAGSPFLANNQSALLSPFTAIYYICGLPQALAWMQLAKALVGGVGAYGFFRLRHATPHSALLGALAFAHGGFQLAWLHYPLSSAAAWLPLGFLAIESVVLHPRGWGGPALALVIGLMLVSGHLETTAHVFAGMGLYALARTWQSVGDGGDRSRSGANAVRVTKPPARSSAPRPVGCHSPRSITHRWRHARPVLRTLVLAHIVGFGLGAVQVIPTLEYLRYSLRMQERNQGTTTDRRSEQPRFAEGIRMAFPYLFGTRQPGSDESAVSPVNFNEGGVNGYAGLVPLIVLAPFGLVLGKANGRAIWLVLGLVFAAPLLKLPGLMWWDHMPPFDLMRNGRAALVTAWCVIALAVIGVDAVEARTPKRAGWILAGVIGAMAMSLVFWQQRADLVQALGADAAAESWFRRRFAEAAVWSLICAVLAGLATVPRLAVPWRYGVIAAAVAELLFTSWGYNAQSPVASYYPERRLTAWLQNRVGSERICGMHGVLTPNVGMVYGLRDVRGYDAVDPLPYLDLIRAMRPYLAPDFAKTLLLTSRPSPILDLLGVRYILAPSRAQVSWEYVDEIDGIVVYRNPRALPRVFVPEQVQVCPLEKQRLARLSEPGFDPRREGVLSAPVSLPAGPMAGSATIAHDRPGEVVIEADMATDGLVVLADAWAPGWRVWIDDREATPLVAYHALRAVRVPMGRHRVTWVYEPRSVGLGALLTASAILGVILWMIGVPRRRPVSQNPAAYAM